MMQLRRLMAGVLITGCFAGSAADAATQRTALAVSATVDGICTARIESIGQINRVRVSCGQATPYSLGVENDGSTVAAVGSAVPFDGAARSYTLSNPPGTGQSYVTATITY